MLQLDGSGCGRSEESGQAKSGERERERPLGGETRESQSIPGKENEELPYRAHIQRSISLMGKEFYCLPSNSWIFFVTLLLDTNKKLKFKIFIM